MNTVQWLLKVYRTVPNAAVLKPLWCECRDTRSYWYKCCTCCWTIHAERWRGTFKTFVLPKKNTEAESKYHSSKLELFAIIGCVARLSALLIGRQFKIVTDSQTMVFLNEKKIVNLQMARRFSVLQVYEKMHHKATEWRSGCTKPRINRN